MHCRLANAIDWTLMATLFVLTKRVYKQGCIEHL